MTLTDFSKKNYNVKFDRLTILIQAIKSIK